MPDPPSFGQWIKQQRLALDLTQDELARRVGCTTVTIRKIEANQRRPSRQLAGQLAKTFALAPELTEQFIQLARGEVPMPRAPLPQASRLLYPMAGAPPLPLSRTALIGRAGEISQVCEFLAQSELSLVTLSGPPGIGKTRLALEAARTLTLRFPDGIYFVPLAGIRDPNQVLPAVGQTLGLHEDGTTPLAHRLQAYLRDQKILLILDNFEQVVAAGPAVAALLTPGLKLLVTSRVVLHLYGEQVFRVPALSLPDPPDATAPETLERAAAVRLFITRAQAVQPTFRLTARNGPAVGAICAWLDGVPLAIELAAARCGLFSPAQLLAQLQAHVPLLSSGPHDVPARHQTLQEAITWSYELLAPSEQSLFARLSVFVGGMTLLAALAVTAPPDEANATVLAGLTTLADHSLIQIGTGPEGEPRLHLLETIREYAAARLVERNEQQRWQARHAEYYIQWAETLALHLSGAAQAATLAQLEADYGNLQAALVWSQQAERPLLGLRLAVALTRFWEVRGSGGAERRWLDHLLRQSPAAPPRLRAEALFAAALLAMRSTDVGAASTYQHENLALRRMLDDQAGIAAALNMLGYIAHVQGDSTRARNCYRESLLLRRASGDLRGCGVTLNNLGMTLRDLGAYAEAENCYAEALALARQLENRHHEAVMLMNLAGVLQVQGLYSQVLPLCEQGRHLAREMGDALTYAKFGHLLGECALADGAIDKACQLEEESLRVYRTLGDQDSIVRVLQCLGEVALAQNDPQGATHYLCESLRVDQAVGAPALIASALELLAAAALLTTTRAAAWRAACLLGAAQALRVARNTPIRPADQRRYDRMVATARGWLGLEYDLAWAAGQAIPPDQIIAYALALPAADRSMLLPDMDSAFTGVMEPPSQTTP